MGQNYLWGLNRHPNQCFHGSNWLEFEEMEAKNESTFFATYFRGFFQPVFYSIAA